MSHYERNIGMVVEKIGNPLIRLEASKIGDGIIIFSPINKDAEDESWCAVLVDCFDCKAIAVKLANKDEKMRFERGFDEMDEDTIDAQFCRDMVEQAIKQNEGENTVKVSNFFC